MMPMHCHTISAFNTFTSTWGFAGATAYAAQAVVLCNFLYSIAHYWFPSIAHCFVFDHKHRATMASRQNCGRQYIHRQKLCA